jgi:hypothetical protein
MKPVWMGPKNLTPTVVLTTDPLSVASLDTNYAYPIVLMLQERACRVYLNVKCHFLVSDIVIKQDGQF